MVHQLAEGELSLDCSELQRAGFGHCIYREGGATRCCANVRRLFECESKRAVVIECRIHGFVDRSQVKTCGQRT
jgi:hypothetical protein